MKKGIFILISCFALSSCTTLQQRQVKQDVDFLIRAINENYPFLQVHKRRDNFNWNQYVTKLASNISKEQGTINSIQFFNKFFFGLNNHVHFLTKEEFPTYFNIYKEAIPNYPEYQVWFDVLNRESVKKNYSLSNSTYIERDNQTNFYEASNDFSKKNTNQYLYIKIPSFEQFFLETEGVKIENYMQNYSTSNKIIIFDIRGNGGGSTLFWTDFLVKPLLTQNIYSNATTLYKNGKLSRPFFKAKKIKLNKITDLKITLNNSEDLRYYQYFEKIEKKIEPNGKNIPYKKIIVIMNESNFSASDEFLDFCKQTKFAQLIGQNSSGDGIGFDPILVELPNSHLVFTIPTQAGLNSDGSLNYEKGITPDIVLEKTIDPLTYIIENLLEY